MLYALLLSPLANVGATTTDVSTVNQQNILLLVLKWAIVAVALLYVVFAFVVVRQIMVMNDTISTQLGGLMLILGYLHLVLSFICFVAVIILL